jgi:phage tail sheath gpL-like
MASKPRRLDLHKEISKDDADDYVRASIGNKKFKRYSDGDSLFLMTRNGRGYWRLQYRDGESFKAKVLGTVADMTPNKARQDRNDFMAARRNARKGIVVAGSAPMTAAAAGAASAGIAPAEPLSALLLHDRTCPAMEIGQGAP